MRPLIRTVISRTSIARRVRSQPTRAGHGNRYSGRRLFSHLVTIPGRRLPLEAYIRIPQASPLHLLRVTASSESYKSDFIESQPPNKTLHEWAESTVEATHFIKRLTLTNQIVLDPFMGSATTGIASLKLNRQFIGIEINSARFKTARYNLLTTTCLSTS